MCDRGTDNFLFFIEIFLEDVEPAHLAPVDESPIKNINATCINNFNFIRLVWAMYERSVVTVAHLNIINTLMKSLAVDHFLIFF